MENARFHDASGSAIAMEVDGQTLFVPADPGNRFYAAMVEAGIVPAPYVEQAPTLADYEAAIAEHVEAVAASRSYSSAASCAGYINSTVPAWAAEAAAFVAWRDAVYLAAFGTMAQVQQGAAAPRIRDLVSSLPMMEWPALAGNCRAIWGAVNQPGEEAAALRGSFPAAEPGLPDRRAAVEAR